MERDGGDGKRRLFVAVPLPAGLQQVVVRAQEALPPAPGLRLLGPEQWHVTLAFIGEVGAAQEGIAREVVEALPVDMGGEATLEGFLMLPSPSRARVVTLELGDENGVFRRSFRGGHGRAGGRRGHGAGEEAVQAASDHRPAQGPGRGATKV